MELIKFLPEENIIFFQVDNIIYKAKVLKFEDKYSVYIFNFKKSFDINLESQNSNKFLPAKLLKEDSFDLDLKFLASPLAGRVIKVLVKEGDFVEKNQPLVIIESMKMENEIRSLKSSFIKNIQICESDLVEQNQVLILFE